MTTFKQLTITLFLIGMIVNVNSQNQSIKEYIYPDSTWDYVDNPVDLGWDVGNLIDLQQFIVKNTNATGFLVIHSGKILVEYGDLEEISYIASCRKSVLSMLYGKYVENGMIDLNKTIGQINIDDTQGILEVEKKAKIKHLLTSRSCVFHPTNPDEKLPKRGEKEPGSFFYYNNWDFNVAGYIFEKETGRSIYEAIDKDFAKPLNMQDWDINLQKREVFADFNLSKFKSYHMWFSTRDMARIGYLMLRNGVWKNQQIIPKEWIAKTTQIVTPVSEMKLSDSSIEDRPWWKWGYGYMWRPWDSNENIRPELEGAYTATGSWGQFITVIPSTDLVVVLKTKSDYRRVTSKETYTIIIDKLLDSKKDNSNVKKMLEKNGIDTMGDIISIRWSKNGAHYFKYRFIYQDKEYFNWSSTSNKTIKGRKFNVRFLPENPIISQMTIPIE